MKLWGESIIGLLGILILVVAVSGCTSSNAFENNIISFDIPVNWTVVDDTTNKTDLYVKLKPSEEYLKSNPSDGNLQIDITYLQSNSTPSNWMNGVGGIAKESPKFKVLKRENVTVDGQPGEWIVFNDVSINDDTLSGPVYTTAEIVFQKNGKTYWICIQEAPKGSYTTKVEPVLNSLISTLKIK